MNNLKIKTHCTDVLIIGSGGAGLSAAIFAANKNMQVSVVSKIHPLQSHTVAAQGGINASLGNVTADDWRWHAYDTIKASGGIADEDSVEEMCKTAPDIIHMLDELGVDFDRNKDNKIDQKIYGGQSRDFGKGEFAHRACYSKDRTGHSIMHKLYEEAISKKVNFFNYNFALDLIMDENKCLGVLCLDSKTGILNVIKANNTIIACGGYSQIYSTATSAAICTGDGNGLADRANIGLQDMEFVQFHPTALSKFGILITEAARAAGGKLFNANGERFMKRYAPKFQELATRDIVSRAISTEIAEGRGTGENKDHVLLDLTHLSKEEIQENLPTIYENCWNFDKLDPSITQIPIAPAAHYTMGGIPTNNNCQVIRYNGEETKIDGLYAIGEAACISVHGAGRLGCNSLLDLLVFGKKAINVIESSIANTKEIDNNFQNLYKNLIDRFKKSFEGEDANIEKMRNDLKNTMSKYVGIFRNQECLQIAKNKIDSLEKQYHKICVLDKSLQWNMELQHYLELGNMISSAKSTIKMSLWRKESRGAHWRADHPSMFDEFQGHSIESRDKNSLGKILLRHARTVAKH